jgi:hypothetical protein
VGREVLCCVVNGDELLFLQIVERGAEKSV